MSYTKIKNDLANGFKLASESKGASKATEHSFKAEFNKRTHSSEWSHHANAQQGKKAITVDQAQRLAKYAPIIQECAKKYNVPVALVCGVILQESGGNAKASSPAGAKGLMQLMPQTGFMVAKTINMHLRNHSDILDINNNVKLGSKYLQLMLDRYKNLVVATAAYNAGPGRVQKWLPNYDISADIWIETIPFKDTREYVQNVMTNTVIYQKLLGMNHYLNMPLIKKM